MREKKTESTRSLLSNGDKMALSNNDDGVIVNGDITFRGITRETKAKYIRIPDKEPAFTAWGLMQDKWKLHAPSLIVSITGAGTDFHLSEKLTNSFKSTILKVSQLNNACIITGGKYGGVTRLVSDALEKSDNENSTGFSCMGIANWDKISNKEVIEESRPYVTGCWLTQKSLNLDFKHTHFLLVKDVAWKDRECQLRSALEKFIIKTYKAPAVRIILNGGVNVLNTIYELISQPNCYPIVIVNKSGRVADVLAYGLKHAQEVLDEKSAGNRHEKLWGKAHEVLYEKYGKLFGGDDVDGWFERCYETILYCLERKDMFIIVDTGDIDGAVMGALLAGFRGMDKQALEKMKLTLSWDRADYARVNIFTSTFKVKFEDLKYMMFLSLAQGKADYVKLLMDFGVNMHEVLTVGVLEFLYGYQALEDNSPLKNKVWAEDFKDIEGMTIDKMDINQRQALDRNCAKKLLNTYLQYELKNEVHIFDIIDDGRGILSSSTFKDPFWELFMWALVCNIPKMAQFVWPFGRSQMAKALIAAEIWGNMSAQSDLKKDTKTTLESCAHSFTALSCRLLERCFSSNEDKAVIIITTALPNFTNTTCLELAADTEGYEFVANNSVQILLDDIWTGELKKNQLSNYDYFTLFMNMFMPYYVSSLIELPTRTEKEEGLDYTVMSSNGRGVLGIFKKFTTFYLCTPCVTYLWHVMGYLFFLLVYMYHITMTSQVEEGEEEHTDYWEQVLILWTIAHAIGEIYHMSKYEGGSLRKKLARWFADGYNKCDLFNLILFFTSWCLSASGYGKNISHTLHAINCASWIIRFLTVFRIHEQLGLYIEMIQEMVKDLVMFVVILFFVILAFSIMCVSLLYPGNANFVNIYEMFLRSWFGIYGSHFLYNNEEPNKSGPMRTPDAILAATNTTVYRYDEYVVWTFFGFYLLFINILLLNIIIAAFNNTYTRIQENADHISRFGKYVVVVEYSTSTVALPPPVSLIYYVVLVLRWLYRKTCGISDIEKPTKLKRQLSFFPPAEVEELVEFEYFCARQVYKGTLSFEDGDKAIVTQMNMLKGEVAGRFITMDEKVDRMWKTTREISFGMGKLLDDEEHFQQEEDD